MPPSLNWMATIDHGLPATLYRFNKKGDKYLAFLGRIAPEKRPDRAIEIAKRAGIPLKIAAKVDPADQEYFAHVIEPLLHDPLVEFIGEIGDHEKKEFLGNALALLFPIDWPEPFWSCHDRSHRDGYAGYRLAPWFGSKGHRRRRNRICCELD